MTLNWFFSLIEGSRANGHLALSPSERLAIRLQAPITIATVLMLTVGVCWLPRKAQAGCEEGPFEGTATSVNVPAIDEDGVTYIIDPGQYCAVPVRASFDVWSPWLGGGYCTPDPVAKTNCYVHGYRIIVGGTTIAELISNHSIGYDRTTAFNLAEARPFTLASQSQVTFQVWDYAGAFGDNSGGVSLSIKKLAPTPTVTPTATATATATPTKTPCPDNANDTDNDKDGKVACGDDLCDRDAAKSAPGQCGCQYKDTGLLATKGNYAYNNACTNPSGVAIDYCGMVGRAVKVKIVSANPQNGANKTERRMRLQWTVLPNLQGSNVYRCNVFRVSTEGGKLKSRKLAFRTSGQPGLVRTVTNPDPLLDPAGVPAGLFPPGDNYVPGVDTPVATPVPAVFEVRPRNVGNGPACSGLSYSTLITNLDQRQKCKCTADVPQVGIWCKDLPAADITGPFYYEVQCQARSTDINLGRPSTKRYATSRLFVGTNSGSCKTYSSQ